jgi:hypothetical protein
MAFVLKQNDTSPSISAILKDSAGAVIDLSSASVVFHMKAIGASTLKIDAGVTVTDPANGAIQYDWVSGDTDTPGTYYAEFQVTYTDGSVESFPNTENLVVTIIPELG